MGYWGVRSDENDDAADALDAGFDRVHGDLYDELTDDRNSLSLPEIQQKLASAETLAASLNWLREEFGSTEDEWDDEARLGFAGVVVRHAECQVVIPDDIRRRAILWLQSEAINWDEATLRRLRRDREVALLTQLAMS